MRNSIVALALLCLTAPAFSQAPSVDDQTLASDTYVIHATVKTNGDSLTFGYKAKSFDSMKECMGFLQSNGELQKDTMALKAKVHDVDPNGTLTVECVKADAQ